MNNYLLMFLITVNLVALIGLWWLYFVGFRNHAGDLTRQRLFVIRDRLFQEAQSGVISFNSAAYKLTRITLNGTIRFVHELSLLRFLLILISKMGDDRYIRLFAKKREKAISALPKAGREAVNKAIAEMHWVILAHIYHTSLFARTMFLPFRWLLMILHLWGTCRDLATRLVASKRWLVVDAEVNVIGSGVAS